MPPPDDTEADRYLDEQIDIWMKQANGKYRPERDDDMRRQLVDSVRCVRQLRKLLKQIDAKYGGNSTAKMVVYLNK